MSQRRQVALIGAGSVEFLYAKIADALRAEPYQLTRYADAAALAADTAALAAVEVILIAGAVLPRAVMAAAPRLRAVLSPVTGTEGIDEDAATQLGIVVATGQTSENYVSMAEATIMLMLACLYDLRGSEAALRDGAARTDHTAHMLCRRRVGLIGFGRIGEAIAQRLQGWEVELVATASRPRADMPWGVRQQPLEALLAGSDIVVVVAALNEHTRNLLDYRRLALMKPGAVLINVARGPIINEPDLTRFAAEGRLSALALDVFAVEPLPADSALRRLPNAILTPHAVGHTEEALHSLLQRSADNVARALRGDLPANPRNPAVMTAWQNRWGRLKSA